MAQTRTLHCTLLGFIVTVVASQLTQEQKDSIVDLHNIYRELVEPQAADMTRMVWSEQSRVVAEQYASQCTFNHNPDVEGIFGENIYITTGHLNISKVLLDWFKEHENYNYDNDQCRENEMCFHYTQLVWAKSTHVGCEAHLCEAVQGLSWNNATLLICNYLPPGNVIGHKPYQTGVPCSQCPENRPACTKMLCDQKHADVVPSTDTEHVDVVPDTDREKVNSPTGGSAVAMCARPSALRLMLAGLLACLVY